MAQSDRAWRGSWDGDVGGVKWRERRGGIRGDIEGEKLKGERGTERGVKMGEPEEATEEGAGG